MRKLPLFALAAAGAALFAGGALAAKPHTHVINVPLPDGSTARVEYVGDVAPKVTVDPRPFAFGAWSPGELPSFAGFDRMMADMQRQSEQMIRQAQDMARPQPGAPGSYVASYGDAPAGVTSMTVSSVSNGSGTCTRTTEVVSQGAGKPPKVTTNVRGNCASSPAAAAQPPETALSRT